MSHKILTIDDSKTIRMIVAKSFKDLDCQILEAENGVIGLSVATHDRPDLIILDYTMPVMDGLETLTRLRSNPDLKGVPVIMLTAEAGHDTVLKIAKLGVRDYLVKPFKEDLLIERVRRVIPVRPKTLVPDKPRRFDDEIQILILDDKPAIITQIRDGVADTPWKISSAATPAEAIKLCQEQAVDMVMASLSLPADAAFTFIQALRAIPRTSALPVFGLCVKTAIAAQTRAQQMGFAGVVTKPLNAAEMKSKIAKTLRLETSYRYFQMRETALVVTVPAGADASTVAAISSELADQLTATVDAGNDMFIIDLSQVQKPDMTVIKMILGATQSSGELGLKSAIIGNDELMREAENYEETRDWKIAPSFEQAHAVLQTAN